MGRKSKNQKKIKAIIIIADNMREIIELDQNENIKNKEDLSKLKKLPKKRNYKKRTKKETENTIKNKTIEQTNESINIINSIFDDSNLLNDFSFEDTMMQDFYQELEQEFQFF